MDLAPAFPPQDSVPVLISDAADISSNDSAENDNPKSELEAVLIDEPPVEVSFLPASSTQSFSLPQSSVRWQTIGLSAKAVPSALMVSVAGVGKTSAMPAGFLSSAGMARSFSFVGQAWRSARFHSVISSAFNRPAYSATVPIEWAADKRWNGKVLAADIQVSRVEATAQVAQMENNVWAAAVARQCMPNARRQLKEGVRYKVSLGDKTLGYVADEKRAYLMAQQLKRLIRQASFDPNAIAAYPIIEDSNILNAKNFVGTPDQALFSVDDAMSNAVGYSSEWAAVSWANNLRLALDAAPLKTGDMLMGLGNLEKSKIDMAGEASWYGPYFHGWATANGETYNQNDLTVAHKSLPFGTQLKVRNTMNDKTVVVRVNDRGPYVGDRLLDLSKAAAECLGGEDVGVIPVEVTVLKSRSGSAQ